MARNPLDSFTFLAFGVRWICYPRQGYIMYPDTIEDGRHLRSCAIQAGCQFGIEYGDKEVAYFLQAAKPKLLAERMEMNREILAELDA